MTSREFVKWLEGYLEGSEIKLTDKQWGNIRNKMRQVDEGISPFIPNPYPIFPNIPDNSPSVPTATETGTKGIDVSELKVGEVKIGDNIVKQKDIC